MDVIEKIIFNTSIVAFLFLIFLAYLMRQIYHKYGLNLTERLYAEKTATELSRQRQSLIHILCHDLGNPLSAIYGLIKSAHLLPEEERSNILVTIEENTKESLEVIEITKKMQAIESGKLEIALRPTSLKTCLLKSLEVLASQIEAKAINIETSQLIEQSVMADATCLTHSIFNNIISNAIKFSPHGAAITLEISDTSPKFSTVTITDQGQGIPPKLLKAVFSDSVATTRKGTAGEQGTGFGMPIVKKMMDALGGKIEIQSPVSEQKQGVKIELTFLKALSS